MISSRRVSPPSANSRTSSALTPSRSMSGPGRRRRRPAPRRPTAAGRAASRGRPRRPRAVADRLAQEPDAVADVAGLVVVDLRVALDEPGQQAPRARGIRWRTGTWSARACSRGSGGRWSTKRTLAARSSGRGDEPLVRLDQGLVEDLAKGGRDLAPRPLDVRGDRRPASRRPRPGSGRRTACGGPRRPAGSTRNVASSSLP